MKKKEWTQGLEHVDPELVEAYVLKKDNLRQKQSKRRIWLRLGAIAACLALLISAIVVVPMLREDEPNLPPPEIIDYTPILFDATASPEQLSGNNLNFLVGSSSSIDQGISSSPPKFQFKIDALVVKARVVKNYPDVYYELNTNSTRKATPYRLIQMECMQVIQGENVPQYFLYLIEDYYYVDMSKYDSLLVSMAQCGTKNYVLKNETANQMEALDLLLFTDSAHYTPVLGNIIAFNNGIFDESLWQNKNWIFGYQFAKHYLDEHKGELVVYRGYSEREVIGTILLKIEEKKKWLGENYERSAMNVIEIDFKTQAAKDAIDYVAPFKNGVFAQDFHYNRKTLVFRRFINGCATEEVVTINRLTEKVTYSKVRYTKEDMAQMENISVHLSEKAKEYAKQTPTPPHTDPNGKELLSLHLYAWYVKVDEKLYGIIKTGWRYKEKDNYYYQYYDEAYVLYDMSTSTAMNIERETLIQIVGQGDIYMGEFGVGIELPR